MTSSPSNTGSSVSAAQPTEQSVESQVLVVRVSLWVRLVRVGGLLFAMIWKFMWDVWVTTEKHLGKLWEAAVLRYVLLNTWNPDQKSWWVRFILTCKIAGLKDAVQKDIGIIRRYVSCLIFIARLYAISSNIA
jgi:hypothetical protein